MGRFVKNYVLGPTATYSVVVPNGTTSQDSNPVNGQLRYNTSSANLTAYFNNKWNPLAVAGTVTIQKTSYVGTGGQTFFGNTSVGQPNALPYVYQAGEEAQALVFIGGVFQNPGINYNFVGNAGISFTSPPPLNQTIVVLHNYASTTANV